jgi:hypothetical protein
VREYVSKSGTAKQQAPWQVQRSAKCSLLPLSTQATARSRSAAPLHQRTVI